MTIPIARTSYASTSPDEAWEALSQMYTRARPHTSSPGAALRVETAATSDVAVDRVWLHAAEGAFSESPDQLNVISVLSGRINLDFGHLGGASNLPGDSYLYLPDSAADLQWDTFSALAVRLPLAVVARSVYEQTDLPPDALRFTSVRPLSSAHGQLWLRTATMVWHALNAPDTLAHHRLVHQELVNTMVAAAVSTFPNTAMSRGYVPGPGDVRPSAVRRAVAFIDSHASLPITVTDIAEAAGVSPRALRSGFRRHLDTTPTAYLQRVRLESTHRDLQATNPDGGHTVAALAARWGFTNVDRFVRAYQQSFGTHPSDTLRQ